jgi:hypothetical protein
VTRIPARAAHLHLIRVQSRFWALTVIEYLRLAHVVIDRPPYCYVRLIAFRRLTPQLVSAVTLMFKMKDWETIKKGSVRL